MPITAEQVEKRRLYVGGSDVAALLGLSPYKNAHAVWMEKMGLVEQSEESDPAEAGNLFEGGILDKAEELYGKIKRNQFRVVQGLKLGVNCDGIVDATGVPVEAKTGGLFGPLVGEWGEELSEDVPDQYYTQCQAQIAATDADHCHLLAFLGGRGFVQYEIHRNDSVIGAITEAVDKFWELVETKTEPTSEPLSLDIAKRIRRVPNEVKTISPELVRDYLKANTERLIAEKMEKALKEQIMGALGTAEEGNAGAEGIVTYYSQNGARRCDLVGLEAEYPDAYAKYVTQGTHRVLRHKAFGKVSKK